MKKIIITILITFFFLSTIILRAQYNEWTWMKGSDTTGIWGQVGTGAGVVLGTQGVAGINNTPPCSYEATQWTDLNGNFWLLGYEGYLWKYDPNINMWTWISNGTINFGVQGIPSINTFPGRRSYGAYTWTDHNNNLWLYGGVSNGIFDANLWKYNISSGLWTWMKGPGSCINSLTVYGTLGVSSAANEPGSRDESPGSTWVDANGNLWFFGGHPYNNNKGGCTPSSFTTTIENDALSDIWKYDMGTSEWTWIGGSNLPNQSAVYGSLGVPSSLNTPGGRWVYVSAKQNNGDILFYGGGNSKTSLPFCLNDLWRYKPTTGEWTWMMGPNLKNQQAVYGTKCISNASDNPGSGFESRSSWTDDCGNLWLFGTAGRNDLWRYSVSTNKWIWVNGTNVSGAVGVYGTMGISSPLNIPPSRSKNGSLFLSGSGANAWRSGTDFFLFGGGSEYGNSKNDLWRYRSDKPTASFNTDSITGCLPITVNFKNTSSPGCNEIKSYLWNFGDSVSGVNDTSTFKNPSHSFNAKGTFIVKLLVINCTGSKDSITIPIIIKSRSAIFSYAANAYCQNASNPLPIYASGGINGAFTSSTGLSINSNTGEIDLSASTPGTFVISNIIPASGPCPPDTATATITINPLPTITVNSVTICPGETAHLIADGGTSYTWSIGTKSTGVNTADVSPIIPTTYTVIGTTNNCSDSAYALVTISSTIADAGIDVTINAGSSSQLNATGGGTYSWSPPDGLSCIDCQNPIARPSQTTTYTVVVTDINGCTAADDVKVKINCGELFVPTAFSPNNDGENDVCYVRGHCIQSLDFSIFNRWGEKVFETAQQSYGWDGTYKSQSCSNGVYIYYLNGTLLDGSTISKKGNITLVK